MPDPVSSPIDMRGGVRGTSGRPLPAHLVARPAPPLDEAAFQLLETLPRGSTRSTKAVTPQAVLEFAKPLIADPTRAGVQALAYLAWGFREAAREKYPDDADTEVAVAALLEKLSKGCAVAVAQRGAGKRLAAKLTEGLAQMYAVGFAAGQAELKKQLPAVVRETTFISDDRGRVVGKTEREFTQGGKR